jgi:type II secretory pathway component PulM
MLISALYYMLWPQELEAQVAELNTKAKEVEALRAELAAARSAAGAEAAAVMQQVGLRG